VYANEQQLDVRLRVSDEAEQPCNADASFSPHVAILTDYLICTNRAPIAQFQIVSEDVRPHEVIVTVDGSQSADPDTAIQSYHWDCGNGQQLMDWQAVCVYARGVQTLVYEIELVVEDYSIEPGCELQSEPVRRTVVIPGLTPRVLGRSGSGKPGA
jgi:hypothetical protein